MSPAPISPATLHPSTHHQPTPIICWQHKHEDNIICSPAPQTAPLIRLDESDVGIFRDQAAPELNEGSVYWRRGETAAETEVLNVEKRHAALEVRKSKPKTTGSTNAAGRVVAGGLLMWIAVGAVLMGVV